jgi:hypothetical protein
MLKVLGSVPSMRRRRRRRRRRKVGINAFCGANDGIWLWVVILS